MYSLRTYMFSTAEARPTATQTFQALLHASGTNIGQGELFAVTHASRGCELSQLLSEVTRLSSEHKFDEVAAGGLLHGLVRFQNLPAENKAQLALLRSRNPNQI